MLIVVSTVAAALLVAAIWASRGLGPTVPSPKTDHAPPTEREAPRPDVGAVASSTSPETRPAPATAIARPPKKTETSENGEPKEQVKRGFIGVQLQDLDPEVAQTLGIEQTRGAVVVGVVPDSPADEAGLRQGDVVVAINGRSVENALYLSDQVGLVRAGERVKLDILRDGRQRQIIATVSDGAEVASSAGSGATADNSTSPETPPAPATAIAGPPNKAETNENGEPTKQVKRGFIGVQLQDLDPEVAQTLGIEQARGAVVVGVVPDSPADEAGLRQGDVVVAVNGRSVKSAVYVRNQVGPARAGERVELDILRDGRQRQIIATVSDGAEVASSAGSGATADNSNESRRSRAVAHFIELFNAESLGKNVRPLTEEELQLLAEVEGETLKA